MDDKTKDIENAKKLGRRDRRKTERILKKKYNDRNLRVLKGTTFSKQTEVLNSEQRRELAKDKNLAKEIMKILNKYLPQLTKMFSELTDKRNKSYIRYKIRTIIMTRLFALICGITTMTEINSPSKFNVDNAIENLSSICKQNLKEIPDWQTIQDVIEEMDITEIEDIRKYIVNALIRSKMFDKWRYNNGAFQLVVDATGISSHDYNLNGNCITKKSKNGVIKYYKQALEAKIVVGNIVISVDTEWIENESMETEKKKQDCEINAFKRMAPRIKKNYPKLKFIITGDALYATSPMINICKDNKWYYIFNLKKDRLKQVYENFQDSVNYENETKKENYKLSCGIMFKGNKLNALSYQEEQNGKLVTFNYVTNLKVTDCNIETIVKMGRKRWKIENEGFNEQKNGTYCISHLCSHNENAIRIHYLFIQIAHLIRQLLENGSIILREMKLKTKKEVSYFITLSLTSSVSNFENLETNFQLRFDY